MNKRILVDTKDYGQKAVDGFNLHSLEEHLYNKHFIETADQMMINAEQVIAFYYEVDLIYAIEEEYLDEDLLELNAMEELRKVVESQNWYMEEYDSFFEFSQISPAGEDFNFNINKNDGNVMTTHDLVKEVKRVYNNFDPEEHVENWIRAKHEGITGIPGLLILVEDSEKIEDMLYELKEALEREFLW